MRSVNMIESLVRKLMVFLAIFCGVTMAVNMVIILADVFMRYVFSAPIQGATELVAILMALVGYFGLGYTLMNGKHIQMTAFYDKSRGRYRYVADMIINGIILATMIVLSYITLEVFLSSFARMEKANSTNTIYVWIGKCGSFIGCVGMLLEALLFLVYSIHNVIRYPTVKHPNSSAVSGGEQQNEEKKDLR